MVLRATSMDPKKPAPKKEDPDYELVEVEPGRFALKRKKK